MFASSTISISDVRIFCQEPAKCWKFVFLPDRNQPLSVLFSKSSLCSVTGEKAAQFLNQPAALIPPRSCCSCRNMCDLLPKVLLKIILSIVEIKLDTVNLDGLMCQWKVENLKSKEGSPSAFHFISSLEFVMA